MRKLGLALLAIVAVTGNANAADSGIMAYLAKTKSLSSMNAAVRAAGLDKLLSGKETLTLLAPDNNAFSKASPEISAALQNPEKAKALLRYHILPGRWKEADLKKKIRDGGGFAVLTTLDGGKIEITMQGDALWLWDKGGIQTVITGLDHVQSNGVVQTVDRVMMP